MSRRQYYVYTLASQSRVIYIGVTGDLARRMREHKTSLADGFTRRYRVDRLVYVERFDDARRAIERERQLKGWRRARKIELIESVNPGWADLGDTL